jgi:holin (3TMs family)
MADLTGIGSLFDFAGKVIDRIFPNPAAREAAKLELLRAQQAGDLAAMEQQFEQAKAQIAVNAVEAASASLFVAGWRPFIGWTCGAAFAYKFVLAPAVAFALAAAGHPLALPVLDFTEMSTVLLGMLGIGSLRTIEKVKGVA